MLEKEIGKGKQVQLWHLVSGKPRAAWTFSLSMSFLQHEAAGQCLA